jgi:uncharacterized RDD family membrane protein YckC
VTKINITTAQNIEISYELATLFDRILAWLIDFILLVGSFLLLALVLQFFDLRSSYFAYMACLVPAMLYHLVCETWMDGRSVGKRTLGLRVVRLDGSVPHFFQYMLRWIFRIVETNPFLLYGSFSILGISFTRRAQRIGDLLGGTVVVKINPKESLSQTLFMETEPGYQVVFPESKKLSDRDASTIKEVINRYHGLKDRPVMVACANKVAHVLGVVPSGDWDASQFLKTVLRDYNHIH